MGDVRHSLSCHPRQSSTHSGTLLPLTTSWAALCLLGFCFFARRGEFYWNQFFSDTGDICRRLCHLLSLLVAHSEVTHLLSTPYAVPHTRNLQIFVLWELLWAWKTTHQKNRREINLWCLPRPLMASIAVHHSFWCDKRACLIVGDAGHARFCQTCDKGWVLLYFLLMNF